MRGVGEGRTRAGEREEDGKGREREGGRQQVKQGYIKQDDRTVLLTAYKVAKLVAPTVVAGLLVRCFP